MTTRLRHYKGWLLVLNDIFNGKKYQASIINNFSIWEKSQDAAVQARKAQKRSKSNKQKGSGSLKEKQIKAPYNKDLPEKCPEALLNSLAKQ